MCGTQLKIRMIDNYNCKSFPQMLEGKKVLYVHGFASSGSSGTVTGLRQLFPSATVVAPDLPIHPQEAMELLQRVCSEEQPQLIIGTSMCGMYAEMLSGFDRIVVNPAFQMGDTISKHNMLGKVTFMNPRADGVQEFMMTKQLQAEYKDICSRCFAHASEDDKHVWGLFGLEDTTVDTYDLFASHYTKALHFHGEHRLNDSTLLHSVVPVVRWIDDAQEHRQKNVVFVNVTETMERGGQPRPSVLKAYRMLIEHYEVILIDALPTNHPEQAARLQEWVFENLGVAAWNRLMLTNRKDLLIGDYLIDATDTGGAADFMGTLIPFGSDTFKTWDDVIENFSRLGGQ